MKSIMNKASARWAATLLCIALSVMAALPVSALEDAALLDVRVRAMQNGRESSILARKDISGELEPVGYYRNAAALAEEGIALADQTTALESAGLPTDASNAAYDSKLRDIARRRDYNVLLRGTLKQDYDSGLIGGYRYYKQLYELLMQEKTLANEAGMISWQSANRLPGTYPDLEDKLWETKYLQYANRRDFDAAAHGQATGIWTHTEYQFFCNGLETEKQQLSRRVEQSEKNIADRGADAGAVIREDEYNDYFTIIARLEEIHKEKRQLDLHYEGYRLDFNAYRKAKAALELEETALRERKQSYPGYEGER